MNVLEKTLDQVILIFIASLNRSKINPHLRWRSFVTIIGWYRKEAWRVIRALNLKKLDSTLEVCKTFDRLKLSILKSFTKNDHNVTALNITAAG